MQNKRLLIILLITIILLLIPLIAMQFTNEVNWTLFDFIIAGFLIFGIGLIFELTLRKIKNVKYRIVMFAVILLTFLLLWAELAVGIFGTPISGQ